MRVYVCCGRAVTSHVVCVAWLLGVSSHWALTHAGSVTVQPMLATLCKTPHIRSQAQKWLKFLFFSCFFYLSSCKVRYSAKAMTQWWGEDKQERKRFCQLLMCHTCVCPPPPAVFSHTLVRAHTSLTSLQTHVWASELWQPVISFNPFIMFLFCFLLFAETEVNANRNSDMQRKTPTPTHSISLGKIRI